MMYKVGSQIFDKNVGLLSSLLIGLSVFHIHYSQEARTYSLSVLLTIFSMYCFVRMLRENSNSILFFYILFSTLLIYSHIYGLFIIISQNIYIISAFKFLKTNHKPHLKRWISSQIVIFFLFSPWLSIFITQTLKLQRSGFWIPTPSLCSIIKSFITYSGSSLLFLISLILFFYSPITCKKICGNFSRKNMFKSIESYCWEIRLFNTDKIYLLLVWLFTPIVIPFIISRLSTPIYWSKYTIVASLAFYILVAKGIINIRNKYMKIIVIFVIIGFSLLCLRGYYTTINKEQWRDVASYIDTNSDNGDMLLFSAGIQDIIYNYYSKKTNLIQKSFPGKNQSVDEKNIEALTSSVEGYKRVWVILSHSKDEKGLITQKINESYNLTYHKEYVGIKIYLYEKKL